MILKLILVKISGYHSHYKNYDTGFTQNKKIDKLTNH